MSATMELLVIELVNQAEQEYLKIKEESVKELVGKTLKALLENKKITRQSTNLH